MNPVIISVNSDLYQTGSITVIGENFNSSSTLLLIDGLEAGIKSMTNDTIVASIPVLTRGSEVYDIRVMTRSQYRDPKNLYSNVVSEFIKAVTIPDAILRQQGLDNRPPPATICPR